ncbi:MAG TPA: hypothetical protein VLA96_02715 [Terriglobales bacterium]|jgi:hypothetical protein|nr:hypothetical protein [Terriglobales bacterium]
MASTFNKRQKERARQEKQRMKAERRLERKREKQDSPAGGPPIDFSAMHQAEPQENEDTPGGDNVV